MQVQGVVAYLLIREDLGLLHDDRIPLPAVIDLLQIAKRYS